VEAAEEDEEEADGEGIDNDDKDVVEIEDKARRCEGKRCKKEGGSGEEEEEEEEEEGGGSEAAGERGDDAGPKEVGDKPPSLPSDSSTVHSWMAWASRPPEPAVNTPRPHGEYLTVCTGFEVSNEY